MEELWGAKVYDQVGATEIGHWGFECQAQAGLHVLENFHLVEIEDIETGAAITEPGRRGSMVVTTFDRFAHPCIRFDSKDIIEWSPVEKCECGRTFRLLKGGVEEVVRGIPELGDEYEVIVIKKGDIDDITLKVEIAPDFKRNVEAVEPKLVQQLRLKTGLRYNLEFHQYGSLPRYDVKSKRFKDLRHKE